VEVAHIVQVLNANADRARDLVRHLARSLPAQRSPSPIDTALDGALITAREARDPAMAERLAAVAGRVLKSES
jgi:5'-methylthioadenosine phosphorylase